MPHLDKFGDPRFSSKTPDNELSSYQRDHTNQKAPWAEHYQMYDYVTRELPELIEKGLENVFREVHKNGQ